MQKNVLKIGLISLLYLIAIVCFYFFLWIPMGEANQLESLITTAEQTQTVLSRSVARKPEIQDELQLTNLSVSEYEDLIPKASDLLLALRTLDEIVTNRGLGLENLQYHPLQQNQNLWWYPLELVITGDFPKIYQVLTDFSHKFPSMIGRDFRFRSTNNGDVELRVDFDLYIIPIGWDVAGKWEPDQLASKPVFNLPANVFGPPFNEIEQFYNASIKVLGIVTSANDSRALIAHQGTEKWRKVGDLIGPARITSIAGTRIKLDVRGIEITLSMEG